MVEEWRVIEDFPDYAVSSLGRVKRVQSSPHCRTSPGEPMKPCKTGLGGYRALRLFKHGKGRMMKVHRIVLTAFVGPPPNQDSEGNHKDGDKDNNTLSNLEWATPIENTRHAFLNGFHKRGCGESGHNTRLKVGEVWLIKRLLTSEKVTLSNIGKMFRITCTHVCRIRDGKTWSHIIYP